MQTLHKKQQQILDLENLAAHRGSLLGRIPGQIQPSQRLFESLLVRNMLQFDTNRPVFVESESSRIGNLQIPASLWKAITKAPLIKLDVPVSARAAYLVSIYGHLTKDPSDLSLLIEGMARRHGNDIKDKWRNLWKRRTGANWLNRCLTCAMTQPMINRSADMTVKNYCNSCKMTAQKSKEKKLSKKSCLCQKNLLLHMKFNPDKKGYCTLQVLM